MNHLYSWPPASVVCAVALLMASGCGRDEVKSYQVSKTGPQLAPPGQPSLPPGHPEVGSSPAGSLPDTGPALRPRVTWKTPAGWTENAPGAMRVGSFNIKGEDNKQADLSIIPLGGGAGGDVANVNRWRGQVGLEPLSADEIRKLARSVEVAGQPADLYEVTGKNPGSGEPMEILAAIQIREGTAWFFKLSGDPGVVTAQHPVFLDFLKSVKFEAPEISAMPPGHPPVDGTDMSLPAGHPDVSTMPLTSTAAAPAAVSNEGKPNWQVPAGWQESPGGQFLVAKFNLSGEGGAQAAVNVSASAGDGGGLVGNVNRWRRQLGLSEQSSEEISRLAASVEVAGGRAALVEMSGTDARTGQPAKVVGVMVPQGSQTWFYKLMGDEKVVDAQKDAFTKFVQTAKY